MSLPTLPRWVTFKPDEPTFAQRVDALVGDRIDDALNDTERFEPVALFALAFETALTVEHLAETLVLRPLGELVGWCGR